MTDNAENFSQLVKQVRNQLGMSQEELAHELRVSFATINRWENARTVPFKLARAQFEGFCTKMRKQGKLRLSTKEA